ncbi:hypothetical protein [Streptobacillus moniliformis]|uniref:hypothetical protein n=1 Tax=Streptobacillus moniliformis TaxID=34105 RepID=UPI0007E37244|nr:hypothetical protein [Streptobacillus moniliformis]
MFMPNEESLKREVGNGTNALKESGAFPCKIKKMVELKAQNSRAEGFRIEFESPNGDFKFPIFYKDKNGEDMKFGIDKLSWLYYLVKNKDLFKSKKITNEYGFEELVCENAEGIEIGVFVDYKGGEEKEKNGNKYVEYKYNIDGFYDIKTLLTAHEIKEKKEPTKYHKMVERYERANEEEKEIKKLAPKNTLFEDKKDEEDEFPF